MNNILSLVLGIAAWSMPVMYLMRWQHRARFCCGSFGLCALALYLQLREVLRLAEKGDFAAIEDTIGAVVFAASMLLTVTLILNALAMLRKERQEAG